MIGKKVLAILFGLLMLAMPVSFTGVSAATESVTVILVSDNAADKCIAEYLANETGAVVVMTTWGVYDPNVTAEIMSYAPDEVIIIGGPEAVVEEYV
ncbi:cell wall-binding repeat 2 family protein, partial [Thermococcus sp. GR7]|nr:cell wall-binding repeat 2 family protein [Thermococcus sp. GR7]NJE78444.1 cell wall-binding repeat 2 family protein [Thermococcus sp. GR4]NJF23259.1 cell wall-binding repeat 2 family protein [Thermococcus sp. GR5]